MDIDEFKALSLRDQFEYLYLLHVELWNWAYANPELEKSQWPRWGINGGDIFIGQDCFCFACEWDDILSGEEDSNCSYCPINWSDGYFCRPRPNEKRRLLPHCGANNSEFHLWELAKGNYLERKMLANVIRNMPWEYKR